MGRIEMVNARTEALSKLTDMQLIDTIVKYFEKNATMPGEKALKDFAVNLKNEFDGSAITSMFSEIRKNLIEQFASLCIKEVKLTNVMAANDTKKRKEQNGTFPMASELPMVLKDTTPIQVNAMKNVYEMPAVVMLDSIVSIPDISTENEEPQAFATLPAGFTKNHPSLNNMKAAIIATDYSNGKFANMSYSMLIDLCQDNENDME